MDNIYIDTHTHLYDEAFDSEADASVERAILAGVKKMVFPDIDSTTREKMFSLSRRHPGKVFPCLGIHPTSITASFRDVLDRIEDFRSCNEDRIYAVGEVGMDLYWSREFEKEQEEALRIQLEWASSWNLPVIIHSRDATGPLLRILKDCGNLSLRGVFHAFSGSEETFKELSRLGEWYIGIGGVLTFKNSNLGETLKKIPLDKMLLETDSPYLTPVPFRGKRNESSYIPYIAQKLAEVKGCSLEEIAKTTTSNAEKLFGI